MFFRRPSTVLALALGFSALSPRLATAEPGDAGMPPKVAAVPNRRDEPLVDIAQACPGVAIELRYATARNLTGKPIYPPGARALIRQSVAERLKQAQWTLQEKGFGLKVWDAYRPPWVQRVLWNAVRDPAFVVQPSQTGSLHSWGVAVDVTLLDFRGREVRMPTDFDAFTKDARYDYRGPDPEVAFNLQMLKNAMAGAGFRHIRDEWWHYSTVDSMSYGPLDVAIDGAPALVNTEPEPTPEPVPPVVFSAPPNPKPTPVARPERLRRPLFPPRPGETS